MQFEFFSARHLSILVMATLVGAALSATAAKAGDAAAGEKIYKKCKACHSLEAGKKKVGPSMAGIIGRTAGSEDGYKYSKLNKAAGAAGLIWTEENMVPYLADPQAFLDSFLADAGAVAAGKTKMKFRLKKADQAADLAAYLATQ